MQPANGDCCFLQANSVLREALSLCSVFSLIDVWPFGQNNETFTSEIEKHKKHKKLKFMYVFSRVCLSLLVYAQIRFYWSGIAL